MPMRAPGGSNTYVPSYDASGPVIEFTRDPSRFRVNQYIKSIGVKKDQGYYLALDADEPYRVVSVNDYLWEDGADAPAGNAEKMEHEFKPYRTLRRSFPFAIGKKAVEQADWKILAAHAKKTTTKAMTLRTVQAASLLTTAANWPAANTAAQSAQWSISTTALSTIQKDINTALIAIEQQSGGIVSDEEALIAVINPTLARTLAVTAEYKDYIKGSPDALAAITDHRNPNRRYGLAPYFYGLKLVVENAVRVTTRKGVTQARSYVWPSNVFAIVSRPEGLRAEEGGESLDFSTCAFRFYEEMTVESKSDPDNRRELGRCVEDYVAQLQAPQTGFLITGIT